MITIKTIDNAMFDQWHNPEELANLGHEHIGYEVLVRRKINRCICEVKYTVGFIEFDNGEYYIENADPEILDDDYVWKLLEEDY